MPTIKEALLGTDEQNRVAQANLDKQAAEGSKLAKFLGGNPEPKEVKETPQPVEKKAKGGKVSSASKRADGIAKKGKTKGKYL
jgi:hypothetical protein